jgi:hypothetical protein
LLVSVLAGAPESEVSRLSCAEAIDRAGGRGEHVSGRGIGMIRELVGRVRLVVEIPVAKA